jgi:hypothetical protein
VAAAIRFIKTIMGRRFVVLIANAVRIAQLISGTA